MSDSSPNSFIHSSPSTHSAIMSDPSTHSSTDSSPSTHSACEEANGSVPSEILLQRFEPQPIPQEQHDNDGDISITYRVIGVTWILILQEPVDQSEFVAGSDYTINQPQENSELVFRRTIIIHTRRHAVIPHQGGDDDRFSMF